MSPRLWTGTLRDRSPGVPRRSASGGSPSARQRSKAFGDSDSEGEFDAELGTSSTRRCPCARAWLCQGCTRSSMAATPPPFPSQTAPISRSTTCPGVVPFAGRTVHRRGRSGGETVSSSPSKISASKIDELSQPRSVSVGRGRRAVSPAFGSSASLSRSEFNGPPRSHSAVRAARYMAAPLAQSPAKIPPFSWVKGRIQQVRGGVPATGHCRASVRVQGRSHGWTHLVCVLCLRWSF